MKKFLILTVLLSSFLWSCDSNETSDIEQNAIAKTDDMKSFERMVTAVGMANDDNSREIATKELVAASMQYIARNNEEITETATDAEIINKALDVHLQRIINLNTN
jgi:hypothetical protein